MDKHFFIGKWKVLRQAQGYPQLKQIRIKYNDKKIFSLQHAYYGRNPSPDITLKYNQIDNTFFYDDDQYHLVISFWRSSSPFDIIFALEESSDERLPRKEIWCARRIPRNDNEPGAWRNALGTWRVDLTTSNGAGDGAADPGYVALRELCTAPLDRESDSSAPSNFGIYGIFHMKKNTNDITTGTLYDLLECDVNTASFRSIFGLRSVHYHSWRSETNQVDPPPRSANARLFAVFRDWFSVPNILSPDLPITSSHREHRLGQPLPFEISIAGNIGDPPEDGDPNVGVWVGEPTEPEPEPRL